MAYRVGIVGASPLVTNRPSTAPYPLVGEIIQSHVASISALADLELVAICDLRQKRLETFVELWNDRWPDVQTYADYQTMLERENLDVLTVATPDDRHAQIVLDSIMAGIKGILCEKPIATSLETADKMIEACKRAKVPMVVNYTRRWMPLYHKVRETIREGAIGQLISMSATHGGPRAMLFRNGTHYLDGMCFFAEAEPQLVWAVLENGFDHWDRYLGDGGTDPSLEPSADGFVRFTNGINAHYRGSKMIPTISKMELTGTTGQIEFMMDGRTATLIPDGSTPIDVQQITLQTDLYQIQGMIAVYQELTTLIKDGGESICSPEEARKALQIALGFLKSHSQGSQLINLAATD